MIRPGNGRHAAPRVSGLAAILLLATLLPGCGFSKDGSRSSWELWQQESRGSWTRLRETVDQLEGGNDPSDIARTGKLLTQGSQGGFGVIGRDLGRTFFPPFSFRELRSTFRLLD